MKFSTLRKIVPVVGLLSAAGAHADNRFSINGYGYQDYRQTNNYNVYTRADKRGTLDNNFFAIVSSIRVSDRDVIWSQLQTSTMEPTRFTWAFINHRFTDNLSIHVGRVKFPYGLYNEYINNKALQLSAVMPMAYSADADMGYNAYSGVGMDWTTGSLFSQVYLGNIYTPPGQADNITDRRLAGVRFTWDTPLDGLRFMLSANTTQMQHGGPGNATPTAFEDRAMFSVDYVSNSFDIKGEYNFHNIPHLGTDPDYGKSNAWYIQAGYKMNKWTPYARYESYQADQNNTSDPSYYQKEAVVGVSYRFTDNINVRLEDHVIHGYALPVKAEAMNPGTGSTNWNMVVAQVNYMF